MLFDNLQRAIGWLLAVVLCALSATALGVEVSHRSGEVLIFPTTYADERFNSLINIRNESDRGLVARAVFRDGQNGDPLLSFDLFLAPFDTWVAATIINDAGAAVLGVFDHSCTTADINDDGQINIGNQNQTWLEVYALGTLSQQDTATLTDSAACPDSVEGGTMIEAISSAPLSGDSQLIDVAGAIAFSTTPSALGNFELLERNSEARLDSLGIPDLGSGQSTMAKVSRSEFTFDSGRDAVSAALLASSVTTSFARDPALNGRTDLLLTFPTRHLYQVTDGNGEPPFFNNTDSDSVAQQLAAAGANRDGERFETTDDETTPDSPSGQQPAVTESQLSVNFATPIVEFSANAAPHPVPTDDSVVPSGSYTLLMGEFSFFSSDGVLVAGLPAIPISISAVRNNTLDFGEGPVEANYGWLNQVTLGLPAIFRI